MLSSSTHTDVELEENRVSSLRVTGLEIGETCGVGKMKISMEMGERGETGIGGVGGWNIIGTGLESEIRV